MAYHKIPQILISNSKCIVIEMEGAKVVKERVKAPTLLLKTEDVKVIQRQVKAPMPRGVRPTSKWYGMALCTKMCTNSLPPGLSHVDTRRSSSW